MNNRIWITWERQRRNRTLSAALGAHLYELDYQLPRISRYRKAVRATMQILLQDRRQLVFAQNPSLLLTLLVLWYGRLANQTTVIDAHNAGIFPLSGRSQWPVRAIRPLAQRLAHHAMRLADITLVSNPALAAYVEKVGGRGFVLPDPLPDFALDHEIRDAGAEPMVLFICTWAADEPYQEVIKAAAQIDPRIRIYITGNSRGRERAFGRPLPSNVILSGFVPEEEFVHLLHRADVVMDLTLLDNCLVCGAYEAVAAGTPMVLSDSTALRNHFPKGAVFTANDACSIARAIEQAITDRPRLSIEINELKHELACSWQQHHAALELLLKERLAPSAAAEAAKR